MKYCIIQPLIGGMAFGAEYSIGKDPEFVIDYKGVSNSDMYISYKNDIHKRGIPHLILDDSLISKTKTFIEGDDILFEKYNKDIDIVAAIPICSGLSAGNTSATGCSARGANAIQNNNMYGITEFVLEKIQPTVYIFENAPALFSKVGEAVRHELISIADTYGYGVTFFKTDTKWCGLPQKRPRTFCVMVSGHRVPVIEQLPKIEQKKIKDLLETSPKDEDMFIDLKNDPAFKYMKETCPNWKSNDRYLWVYNYITDNNKYEDAKRYGDENYAKMLDHIKKKLDDGKNYMACGPSFNKGEVGTIWGRALTCLCDINEERGYTIREYMRFMGMPDDFPITKKDAAKIGQNVPSCTAKYFIDICKNIVNGSIKTIDGTNLMIRHNEYFNKHCKLF